MKLTRSFTALLFLTLGFSAYANEFELHVNAPDLSSSKEDTGLPKNWRKMSDDYKPHQSTRNPSREGLADLRASGSADFSEGQLKELLSHLQGKEVLVVDLRREPHGYADHIMLSWFKPYNLSNVGKTTDEINQDEVTRLAGLLKDGKATIIDHHSTSKKEYTVNVSRVATEMELVQKYGASYVRIPISDLHGPDPQQVDQIIEVYKRLKKNPNLWAHVHCQAGMGRTTSTLAVLDMMKNASKVEVEDILERQRLLGGYDLVTLGNHSPEHLQWSKDRLAFLRKFHEYAKAEAPEFNTPWSVWVTSTSN